VMSENEFSTKLSLWSRVPRHRETVLFDKRRSNQDVTKRLVEKRVLTLVELTTFSHCEFLI
jgi:hypothetical protein